MLGTPKYGWVEIFVNGKRLGTASYLDWVPGLILEPCIRYLKCAKADYERWEHIPGGYGLNIEFDAEGHSFGIVQIGNRIYTYDDCDTNEPYIRILDAVCDYLDDVTFIKNLVKEVINDIRENFEAWTWWDAINEEERKNSEKELNELLKEAELCLQ